MFMDVRTDIADGFDPPNADNRERGPVRVRDALKYSLNIPVSKAQQLIGTENVVDLALDLGLEFDPAHNGEYAVPSLTLGTLGIHQLDLAGAYGALANGGRLQEPYLIERIEDADGNVIYDHATDADDGTQVLSPGIGLPRHRHPRRQHRSGRQPAVGPALPARDRRRPPAGDAEDRNDQRLQRPPGLRLPRRQPGRPRRPDRRDRDRRVGRQQRLQRHPDVFAADGPTFIWHDYMAEVAALNELPVYDFRAPRSVTEVEVDAMSGMLPGEFTETTVTELVRVDRAPTQQDTTHRELAIEAETGKIWQEGCGDFEPAEPSDEPDRRAEPLPPEAELRVYLDLAGWESNVTRRGTSRTAPGSSAGPSARTS